MFHGVLVTNAFLRTDKFVEHYEWLKEAAEQYDIALSLLENTDLLCLIPGNGDLFVPKELEKVVSEVDFVLFWDKDVPYGKLLQDICKKKRYQCLTRSKRLQHVIIKWRHTAFCGNGI